LKNGKKCSLETRTLQRFNSGNFYEKPLKHPSTLETEKLNEFYSDFIKDTKERIESGKDGKDGRMIKNLDTYKIGCNSCSTSKSHKLGKTFLL